MASIRALLLLCSFKLADFTDPPCVVELECRECVPDNAPLVTSHRAAADGSVTAAAGDELVLACAGGKFLAYPLLDSLRVVCEAGRYRVPGDGSLRHLLELGCQENIFEDVLHQVDGCHPPLQGRSYQMREPGRNAPRHIATVCFDEDRAIAVRLHMSSAAGNRLATPPHDDRAAPLSILGNFNHMFDAKTRHEADKLYSDDVRMNRRLREAFKHDRYSFAGQTLTSVELLSGHYFEDQNVRVSEFVSNRAAVWGGVAGGNLRHAQRDVAALLRAGRRALDVYAGTHGVLSLRAGADGARADAFLKAGGRFPVPKYVWTVVHARDRGRAAALIVLNDPFVAVSEIRESVFCESACGRVSWARELRRHRNYEVPAYGLAFCCHVAGLAAVVPGLPPALLNVTAGDDGLLAEFI